MLECYLEDTEEDTERDLRPLRRRAVMVRLPVEDFMRVKNPCFFARFRFFGW